MKNSFIASVAIGLAITLGIVWLIFLFQKEGDSFVSRVTITQMNVNRVRKPAVAGAFYPDDKMELTAQLEQLFASGEPLSTRGFIRAMVVPHAGYVYSGKTAAHAYKALSANVDKENRTALTVILIGSGHTVNVRGAVIDAHDRWETPLGEVAIATDIRDMLLHRSALFTVEKDAHREEHSLEVQVPFLQYSLSHFKILPILLNSATPDEMQQISHALASIDGDVVIIASSDLSHYPSYDDAKAADEKVIASIMSGEIGKLKNTLHQLAQSLIPQAVTFLCAQPAVEVALEVAQLWDAKESRFLHYSNSGDAPAGDKARVVGYTSLAFISQRKGNELVAEEKETLLRTARASVESYVKTAAIPHAQDGSFFLNQARGAFVTIKKNGILRGCIGRFEPDIPLLPLVSQMAIAAATEDHRFLPVSQEEIGELIYEISVLSPLRKIKDWREIEIGTHGVRVRKGSREGVFLPQVATENNWGLEEFMGELCSQKMGMASDCWKDPHAELYVFTAQVFGE